MPLLHHPAPPRATRALLLALALSVVVLVPTFVAAHPAAHRRSRAPLRPPPALQRATPALAPPRRTATAPLPPAVGCERDRSLQPTRVFCDDFSTSRLSHWQLDGGAWSVADGRLIGRGSLPTGRPCRSPTDQALIRGLHAHNVDLRVDMTSLTGADKLLVLRSVDPSNQIELNLRAARPGAYPADLIVQERTACQLILHTPEFAVRIPPHHVGQPIHVRVLLIDNHLRVWIDGVAVLNQTFPFAVQTGRVGLSVSEGSVTAFDHVNVQVLK